MKKKGLYASHIVLLSIIATPSIRAAELAFFPSVRTTAAHTESSPNGPLDTSYVEVTPSIALSYQSAKLTTYASISNRYFYRDVEDDTSSENFITGNYNARYELIDASLYLLGYGSQSYNSINASTLLIDDLATTPQNQTKTKSNSAGFEATNVENSWFALSGRAIVSKFESDNTSDALDSDQVSIDNTNYTSRLSIRSGKRFSRLNWIVNDNYRKTERDDGENSSRHALNGNIRYEFVDNWQAIVRYNESVQRFDNIDDEDDTFRSYGAGLRYDVNNNFIDLVYNKVAEQSNFSDTDNDEFFSFRFNFRLSPRTQLSGSRDQDFYGDTESLRFTFANRKFRLSTQYSEEVTATSTAFGEDSTGVFVCPADYLTVDDCFIPDSLTYTLQPGETFQDLSTFQDSLNDDERVRKSLTINTGYRFNRLTVAVQGRRTRVNFLGSNETTLQHTASGSAILRIGVKTSLRGRAAMVISEPDDSEFDNKSYLGSLGLYYQLNNDINFFVEGQYRVLESDVPLAEYQERRVLFNMSYTPGRQRARQLRQNSRASATNNDNGNNINNFNNF